MLLGGHSIFNGTPDLMDLRRRIGMLFQRPSPFPMSIIDNVVAGVRAQENIAAQGLRRYHRKAVEVGLWEADRDDAQPGPSPAHVGVSRLQQRVSVRLPLRYPSSAKVCPWRLLVAGQANSR